MWGRALAGLLPGFFVSAGVIGLASWSLPGPWQNTLVGALAAFFPLWMGVFAASFSFTDARRAWTWLTLGAAASLATLVLLRTFELVV